MPEDEVERLRDHFWRENVSTVETFLNGNAFHFQVLVRVCRNVAKDLQEQKRVLVGRPKYCLQRLVLSALWTSNWNKLVPCRILKGLIYFLFHTVVALETFLPPRYLNALDALLLKIAGSIYKVERCCLNKFEGKWNKTVLRYLWIRFFSCLWILKNAAFERLNNFVVLLVKSWTRFSDGGNQFRFRNSTLAGTFDVVLKTSVFILLWTFLWS